jgi:dTDP-4-dehydrorhamnose 3,5-epimerase
MEFIKTKFDGAWIIKPAKHCDARGFFLESYSLRDFEKAGIPVGFVQDNHSMSVEKGVLRGLHLQTPPFTQGKLVRAVKGAIFDVIVDLRKSSPTYGQWEGFTLTESSCDMLFAPRGFAHGFCTLVPNSEVIYKADNYYAPANDGGLRWNDPDIGVKWPVETPVLSKKDGLLPFLKDFNSPF